MLTLAVQGCHLVAFPTPWLKALLLLLDLIFTRRNNSTPHASQGHYNPPPRPAYQGMPPNTNANGDNSPGQMIFQAPMQMVNPSFGPQQGNPPSNWGGPSGTFNYNTPPSNLSRDGNFSNPGFVQGNPPYVGYGQGRGQRFNSGRSRGSPGNSQGPRSGFGGRRGSDSHECVSAEQRPYVYYRKEMVEDPWEMLSQVVWKDTEADKSWLPKSISMKKAKVCGEASQTSKICRQSLAEYLAASFKDSTDDDGEGIYGT